MPGAGALHNSIAALVYELLRGFVRAHDPGLAFTDGVGYVLARAPDQVRIPDASFVSWERVPVEGVPEGFWPLAPDLAVEVVSPNDRAEIQKRPGYPGVYPYGRPACQTRPLAHSLAGSRRP